MKDFPFPLVVPVDGEARASSEIIARGVGLQHKNVLELIRRYRSDFEQLGPLAFETRKGRTLPQGGRAKATEYAMLNEHQATLLITFMRNSPKVVSFKIALVKEFFRMRDELGRREQSLWQQMQALIAREVESKVRASFGSHLMLARRRELPALDAERELLERQMQPSLLN
ncbi:MULTISPECIES: Rha family transcriptional regulator [Burkholderia cepacia complex]|nr:MULTISPECIES: Rha family transcriptional regulator [Burkholderia cepacia complex]MBU9242023.1 Rha family transcriptional regulator [Burkholderia multivorans]MBU9316526.1 Rha family transcriptional regulator [Burkholderia multivorans]MBY4674278.1 Rha family transcriptional regulator [Burkholderia multivorans]MBY4751901.1 Rha family transcriptional regulator [Burkholderia dolosa]MCA7959519.1 Rha family transcriptional regulator [Burkholderia multivorans]